MALSNLELSHARGKNLCEQVVHALESAIDQGELSPGARLPSERELAGLLKLSRTTTTNAYRELESRGVLRRHVGRGTFVCATPEPDEVPFALRGKVSAAAWRSANPLFQNPTGHTLSLNDRRELLKLLARYRIPVVEDDTYRDLFLDAPAPPSLRQLDEYNVVIYSSTFSKTLAPGLRVGWIAANEVIVDQLALLKQNTDVYSPNLPQLAIAEMLHSGLFDDHLRKLREEHTRRRDALIGALERYVPSKALTFTRPLGGMYIWCHLDRGLATARLLPEAKAMGMMFASGEVFYGDEAGGRHLRLCFSGRPADQIEEGIKRFAKALAACSAAARGSELMTVAMV